jgi:hypothetical protein
MLASLQPRPPDYPSDFGLPLYAASLPRNGGYYSPSSLQPTLFPMQSSRGHSMLPDEQYPSLPFRSPYIHTADSGPSAIVYYPQRLATASITTSTFQPIYESIGNTNSLSQPQDIYSQVSKRGNETEAAKKPPPAAAAADDAAVEAAAGGCETDSAALERLSQLLTTSSSKDDSELSVMLDNGAPIAMAEDSLGGSTVQSEDGGEAARKDTAGSARIYQELDDAFTTLDQELADNKMDAAPSNGRLFSAPTSI